MKKIMVLGLLLTFLAGWLIPETVRIPVQGAKQADWNPQSFWYCPWGRSGTHKGIDIFAAQGTPVLAATQGWVIRTGENAIGGKFVLVLGAKWRLHYYAHLHSIEAQAGHWIKAGSRLGSVGNSGNARNTPAHLHYSIRRLLPNPAYYEANAPQGWRKMFYINPHEFLTQSP